MKATNLHKTKYYWFINTLFFHLNNYESINKTRWFNINYQTPQSCGIHLGIQQNSAVLCRQIYHDCTSILSLQVNWEWYINLVSKRLHFQPCSCPSTVMLVVYTFCVSHSDHRLQGILCLPWHNIPGQYDIMVTSSFQLAGHDSPVNRSTTV
jgi:hypothetical protein